MFSWNPNSFCVQSKGYLCMRTYTLLTNSIKNAEKFGIWQYSEYDDCKVNGLVIIKSNIVNSILNNAIYVGISYLILLCPNLLVPTTSNS